MEITLPLLHVSTQLRLDVLLHPREAVLLHCATTTPISLFLAPTNEVENFCCFFPLFAMCLGHEKSAASAVAAATAAVFQ